MFKKIHNILGKLFLACTAFFWFSCDNANSDFPVNPPDQANQNSSSSKALSSSSAEPKPFIDIDQELAKLTTTDTTGLRGKCIPKYEYCEMINGWNSHYAAESYAASIAIVKLKEKHKDIPNFWYGNNSCYYSILGGLGNVPLYGVPECPVSGPTPCETDGNNYSYYKEVYIDDAYIEALQQKEKGYYETVKSTLEEINQGMKECN